MDVAIRRPTAQPGQIWDQQFHQATMNAKATAEVKISNRARMERVSRWISDCAQSRATVGGERQQGCVDYDGETEDLYLRVLVARPRFQKIPTASEVRQFADQLRLYNSRLWTLQQTRGYFRTWEPEQPAIVPEYPENIDHVDDEGQGTESLEMDTWEEPEKVTTQRREIVGRKISPVEEDLRDEMIREYWSIRLKKAGITDTRKRRVRSVSSTDEFCRKFVGHSIPYRPRNPACLRPRLQLGKSMSYPHLDQSDESDQDVRMML